MPAVITELIDKVDTFEVIRDRIAEILKVESANQVALAQAAGKPNPNDWALRVFIERSTPWAEFQDDPESRLVKPQTPIVNVWFQRAQFDGSRGDVVERQMATPGLFNVDCYGLGVSRDHGAGHVSGDELASRESQRAIRWCRNILMSAHYTRLGFPLPNKTVGRRWPDSIEVFQPEIEKSSAQKVMGARLVLAVDFNELSPQVVGQPLETVSTEVTRGVNGEVLLTAQINFTP